ncbi:MAG TPA: acetoacetate decarboxylase family protein [Mycobacteriales bacterium]|nr:acetoacetate decarboxylase family protein [Mycobacteriales bacterium]
MTVRYGAKTVQRNREIEATATPIWVNAVQAVWETDPEVVAAILPPPLTPAAKPLVRLTLSIVDLPGLPVFGAGWLGVAAMHGDVPGEYPVFMPMTSEQATIGGRETYGEPKKIAEVWAKRDGDTIDAGISRLGFSLVEISGRVTEQRAPYQLDKRDFWFKALPSAETPGELEGDPILVYGEKHEEARVHEGIDGTVVLKDSPIDPVADLVVRNLVDLSWTERASSQVGKVIGPIPAAGFAPYLHQRYDDLTVLGK